VKWITLPQREIHKLARGADVGSGSRTSFSARPAMSIIALFASKPTCHQDIEKCHEAT
jgi:hypothetical protein